MLMSKIYTDYVNKTAISVPETYIDVKTGESHTVSSKVQDQIEYHSQNSTLIHLLFSALTTYLHPRAINGGTEEILFELSEIKKILQQGTYIQNHSNPLKSTHAKTNRVIKRFRLKRIRRNIRCFWGLVTINLLNVVSIRDIPHPANLCNERKNETDFKNTLTHSISYNMVNNH